MKGGEGIRYLVIQPSGDIHVKVGVFGEALLKRVLGPKWGFMVPREDDYHVFLQTPDSIGEANPLAETWLRPPEPIRGPVVVAGPADGLTGVPTDVPFDLVHTILRYQEEAALKVKVGG